MALLPCLMPLLLYSVDVPRSLAAFALTELHDHYIYHGTFYLSWSCASGLLGSGEGGEGGVLLEAQLFDCGWCVVLLMRYLGIVWGPGYPREQVGAVLPPIFQGGARAGPSSNPRNCLRRSS